MRTLGSLRSSPLTMTAARKSTVPCFDRNGRSRSKPRPSFSGRRSSHFAISALASSTPRVRNATPRAVASLPANHPGAAARRPRPHRDPRRAAVSVRLLHGHDSSVAGPWFDCRAARRSEPPTAKPRPADKRPRSMRRRSRDGPRVVQRKPCNSPDPRAADGRFLSPRLAGCNNRPRAKRHLRHRLPRRITAASSQSHLRASPLIARARPRVARRVSAPARLINLAGWRLDPWGFTRCLRPSANLSQPSACWSNAMLRLCLARDP